jgi:hypothetical protein
MDDFLSRLIERSAGRAQGARPAVAPLFAPGPDVPDDVLDIAADDPFEVVPTAPWPLTPPDDAHAAQRAPAERHRPVAGPAATVPAESVPAPAAVDRRVGDSTQATQRAQRADVTGTYPAPFSHIRAPSPARRGAKADDHRATLPRRRARADGRPPSPALDTVITAGPHPHDADLSREIPVPRRDEEAPTAPIIRVSIGRIEVRAVSAPPAAAPRAVAPRTPASLSLEEYLRPRGAER